MKKKRVRVREVRRCARDSEDKTDESNDESEEKSSDESEEESCDESEASR